MRVIEIEDISKSRRKVLLEDDSILVLYRGELRDYQIEEGKELSAETLLELRTRVLPGRARQRALHLLQARQYTERQLMDKLLLGGYDAETAKEAVDYVKSYHYVDDARYARDYITSRLGRCGRREIEQKLLQKGVDRQVISQAMEELSGEELFSEEEIIRTIFVKKNFAAEVGQQRGKQRIYGYFYRRGFSLEMVRRVIEESFT